MPHSIQERAEGQVISFSGRITFRDSGDFKNLLGGMKALSGRRVVFDFSDVEFLDSAALGMLLQARDKVRGGGASFSLRGVRGQVKRIMDIVKFDQALA